VSNNLVELIETIPNASMTAGVIYNARTYTDVPLTEPVTVAENEYLRFLFNYSDSRPSYTTPAIPSDFGTYTVTYLADFPSGDNATEFILANDNGTPKGVIGPLDPADLPLLDEDSITTSTETIAAGNTFLWEETISFNRLYGVSLAVTGLTAGQTASLRLFGDAGLTDEQYLANFTSTSSVDNAQAWRYRDREVSNTIRIQVENTSAESITINAELLAEPF